MPRNRTVASHYQAASSNSSTVASHRQRLAIAVPGLMVGGWLQQKEHQLRSEIGELAELMGGAWAAKEAA